MHDTLCTCDTVTLNRKMIFRVIVYVYVDHMITLIDHNVITAITKNEKCDQLISASFHTERYHNISHHLCIKITTTLKRSR